jgi:hypothetical protein
MLASVSYKSDQGSMFNTVRTSEATPAFLPPFMTTTTLPRMITTAAVNSVPTHLNLSIGEAVAEG